MPDSEEMNVQQSRVKRLWGGLLRRVGDSVGDGLVGLGCVAILAAMGGLLIGVVFLSEWLSEQAGKIPWLVVVGKVFLTCLCLATPVLVYFVTIKEQLEDQLSTKDGRKEAWQGCVGCLAVIGGITLLWAVRETVPAMWYEYVQWWRGE